MALIRYTLTLFFISTFLLFALYVEATSSPSSSPSQSPSPTSTPTSSSSGKSTSTPSSTPTSTPSPTSPPAGGPSGGSSISLSELFELALPEIGVQKKVVTSNTQGAKVASIQLQAVERKINEFKLVLKKRLADPNTPKPAKACLTQCQGNFEDAIDGVKTSIQSIDKKNLPKANIDISAISSDVDTCNDCFLDMMDEDKEIKAFDDWVQGVTGDCLVNLRKP